MLLVLAAPSLGQFLANIRFTKPENVTRSLGMIHFCLHPGPNFRVSWSSFSNTSKEAGHHFAVQGILQAHNTAFLDVGMFRKTVFYLVR